MENHLFRNVKLVCTLNIGDTVRTDGWGAKLDNKDWIVQDIQRERTPSGFTVKINGYNNYLDSNWLIKIPQTPKLF